MTTPISVSLAIVHEQNSALFETTRSLLPFGSIIDCDDLLLYVSQQLVVRIEALFSVVQTAFFSCIHCPQELAELNYRMTFERGFFTFATLKVNLLFLATIVSSIVLQAGAVVAPEWLFSSLQLQRSIDQMVAALLSEIPASLSKLFERLQVAPMPVFEGSKNSFRLDLQRELQHTLHLSTRNAPTSSFLEFDWTLFRRALEEMVKKRDPSIDIEVLFRTARLPIRGQFAHFFDKLVGEAQRDLIAREIYPAVDFEANDENAAKKAAELLAVYLLATRAEKELDGFCLTIDDSTLFLSENPATDPLHAVQDRGFGVEVRRKDLYGRLALLQLILQDVPAKEQLRDLLQSERVDEAEFRANRGEAPSRAFFREVTDASLSEEESRRRLIQEARAMMQRQGRGIEPAHEDVKALHRELQQNYSEEERAQFRRALFNNLPPNERMRELFARTLALSAPKRSLLLRLLSPRHSLNPATIQDRDLRDGYLHIVTLRELIKLIA